MLSVHNKRFSCVLYAGILYINFNCWQKIIENHFVQYKKYFNIYSNFYDAIRLLLYIRYIFCNHWPRCSHIWTGKSDILLFRALSRDFHASEASCWSRQMVWLQSYSDQTFFFFLARCFLTFSYWYIAHQRFNFPMSKDCSIIFLIYGYFAIFWFSAGGYHLRADLLL